MDIIIKPLITERMTELGEKLNRFGFIVHKKATKPEIRAAVESLYNVKVVSVNTNLYGGKKRVRNTKSGVIDGRTSAYKKAIVTLKEGEKIDFYSNI
ncbi:MAG: 50S ribosomal protein L23 [Salinivirgaceae bacterium]|nr:50S ribosomal protein L23 [Salinivirgaceae bacterium]MDD4745805.1 50S ribosomal protein L23 [Salinivirgaceae bacterium]MDY0279227.1 50S ribosomal protein L23 [Salinivirgaceae bacterium]